MAGNNESTVSEIIDFNESAVMNSPEVHSTPNVGQDDKNMNTSVTDEKDITEDSGVQLTPTSTKCNKFDNDVMSFLLNQFKELKEHNKEIKSRFDSNDKKFDNKFDKLSSEIHEQKVKCESNFSELKNRRCV